MFLQTLEIKNYRSLEHVVLAELDKFNVLIGRNNSGKSAIFDALGFLNRSIRNTNLDWDADITEKDTTRSLEMRLLFKTRPKDRDEVVNLIAKKCSKERREAMCSSPLFRQIEYWFKNPSRTRGLLHLRQVKIMAEDNKWATVQKLTGNEAESNPEHKIVSLCQIAETAGLLTQNLLDVDTLPRSILLRLPYNCVVAELPSQLDPVIAWVLHRLDTYLSKAFFFSPFRHSSSRLEVKQIDQLTQDGSNLAQILHTINSKDRHQFDKIERFLKDALPDLGTLQTPLNGNETEVVFRPPDKDYFIQLHNMGGGVEQLLMIATVLFTTGNESTLFLEEPESHLHPGAQRFLIEQLNHEDRQVFINTHSPTFVNLSHCRKLFQVQYDRNRTNITLVNDADLLNEVLYDIGSRNSDVLLSDAVLFVEGTSDKLALQAWSERLNMSLEKHNVTVIPMGGGDNASRNLPVRSDVLQGISQKTPVPHLFVLDRDERSSAEIDNLQKKLGDHLHIFEKRELENYLLFPRALLAAIKEKHNNDKAILNNIGNTSEGQLNTIIMKVAEKLKGLVLMKRIRAEIGGLKDGLLPRKIALNLVPKTNEDNLAQLIQKEIESRVSLHISDLRIDQLVSLQRQELDREWANSQQHLSLSPGEEIINKVFHHFGAGYKKPSDTERIAREMKADEIADEIKELIEKTVALTKRTRTI